MPNYSVHTRAQIYFVFAKQRLKMKSVALNSILLINLGIKAFHYTLEHCCLKSRETSSSFSMVMFQIEYLDNQISLRTLVP
jgi:hypothetical protein